MGGWKISSEAVREKYYNADGTPTDLNKALTAKLQPTMDQLGEARDHQGGRVHRLARLLSRAPHG